MNKLTLLLSLSISAALVSGLSGCGGGGSSSGGSSSGGTSSGGTSSGGTSSGGTSSGGTSSGGTSSGGTSSGGTSSGGTSSGGTSSGGSSSGGSSSGGSSSGGSSSGGSSSGGGTASVPFTCDSSEAFEGTTYKAEMGSNGKIKRTPCEVDTALSKVFVLDAATPSLNIKNVSRKITIDMSCESGGAKGTIDFDYTAGSVTFNGNFNGAPANKDGTTSTCTDHYASPLPATLSTPESIKTLLATWGYDPIRADDATAVGLTSTDCSPEVAYSQYADQKCNGSVSENISVTDDTGVVHSMSSKITKTSP